MYTLSHRGRGILSSAGLVAGLALTMSLVAATASAQGVVTLETPAPPGTVASPAPGSTPAPPADPEEAVFAYVECMREHGVDMPDPRFDANGGVMIMVGGVGEPGAGVREPDAAVFQEAQEACASLMPFDEAEVDPEQQAEMQAQALAFAQCMREHGVEMPDPRFDGNGGVSIMVGGPDGARIDPEVMQEAQEACGGGMFGVAPGGPAVGDEEEDEPAASEAIP